MKAIKVYLGEKNASQVSSVVEKLNQFEDTTAIRIAADQLFIAAVGQCAITYAKCLLNTEFKCEMKIKIVK